MGERLQCLKFTVSNQEMNISSTNADAFVTEVLMWEEVWCIKDSSGIPTSTNASGETSMPFWSSEARARSIIETVAAYSDFRPEPIALATFVERWIPGLTQDGFFCGLNWSGKRATGYDLSPADLMARLEAAKARA